ncbi:hypothetical protein Trco_001527 [Trichoderma cornu-damae]|uniref:Uncharacterized protein n=1 Tax=Trichoderma cornu-damae TaxID=654480 RepID=A0A9P8QZ20_9HYPO|nr:hypothetical protein Trco_001527 [Trichoderma cornu-damae]
MKLSAIASLSIFALLGLALAVFALPPEPQGVEGQVEAAAEGWPPEEPPPVNDIVFLWCLDYNMPFTCFSKRLKHGWCYNLPLLGVAVGEQIGGVGAFGGQCMMFNSLDCNGHHTAMFTGDHVWMKDLCPKSKVKWHRSARSSNAWGRNIIRRDGQPPTTVGQRCSSSGLAPLKARQLWGHSFGGTCASFRPGLQTKLLKRPSMALFTGLSPQHQAGLNLSFLSLLGAAIEEFN